MKRVVLLFVVLAAVLTIGCGGSDDAGSSPTGPSSPPGSQNPPPPSQSGRPSAPANLTVAVSGGQVTLAWSAVSGATQYLVLVGTTPGSSNTLSTNTTNNNYTWTVGSGVYYARVQARNANGDSGSSNEVSFAIQ